MRGLGPVEPGLAHAGARTRPQKRLEPVLPPRSPPLQVPRVQAEGGANKAAVAVGQLGHFSPVLFGTGAAGDTRDAGRARPGDDEVQASMPSVLFAFFSLEQVFRAGVGDGGVESMPSFLFIFSLFSLSSFFFFFTFQCPLSQAPILKVTVGVKERGKTGEMLVEREGRRHFTSFSFEAITCVKNTFHSGFSLSPIPSLLLEELARDAARRRSLRPRAPAPLRPGLAGSTAGSAAARTPACFRQSFGRQTRQHRNRQTHRCLQEQRRARRRLRRRRRLFLYGHRRPRVGPLPGRGREAADGRRGRKKYRQFRRRPSSFAQPDFDATTSLLCRCFFLVLPLRRRCQAPRGGGPGRAGGRRGL